MRVHKTPEATVVNTAESCLRQNLDTRHTVGCISIGNGLSFPYPGMKLVRAVKHERDKGIVRTFL